MVVSIIVTGEHVIYVPVCVCGLFRVLYLFSFFYNIMIRNSPASSRKRIVCADFVRVHLPLVLPITVSSSLMRLMDRQISPQQFSVFLTSKLAEVTTYSPCN